MNVMGEVVSSSASSFKAYVTRTGRDTDFGHRTLKCNSEINSVILLLSPVVKYYVFGFCIKYDRDLQGYTYFSYF